MFSQINNITLLLDEPLSKHSSLKIGGNAKYFIQAHTIDALLDTIFKCTSHHLKCKIIGGGSNMLFDDKGYEGAIIQYTNNFKKFENGKFYASAGNGMSELIRFTSQHNLGGFEFAVGVPANLGGAIANNLGAYNQDISQHIEHITVLKNRQLIYLTKKECDFGYHSSIFQKNNYIILSAIFNLPNTNKYVIDTNVKSNLNKRLTSQPLNYPNAGSAFRRENNIIPAKLIDDLGLKGLSVGGAEISTKHAGFIINKGSASCKDVLVLIEIIKQKVYQSFNIVLTPEIEYLPF